MPTALLPAPENRPRPTAYRGPQEDPEPQPEPEAAPEGVEVPELSGMTRTEAEQTLANLGLEATTKSRSTDQYPAGTVISQSPKAGDWVLLETTISLAVAKTPPGTRAAPPPQRHPRQTRAAAIGPIPTCAWTQRSRTMTVRAGQATDPRTLRADPGAPTRPVRSGQGRRRLGLRNLKLNANSGGRAS